MRQIGTLHPTELTPVSPDTVGSVIISTAGGAVAQDYPTGTHIVRFSGTMNFYVNFGTTSAVIPSTNSSGTTASSGLNELMQAGWPEYRQVAGSSTGYSITAPTSGVITASFWKK